MRETAWEWTMGQSKGREARGRKEATISFRRLEKRDLGIAEIEDTKKRLVGLKS